MDRDSMATDVRYALGQLRQLKVNRHMAGILVADAAQRAIDALERVEASLAGPLDPSEATFEAAYDKTQRGVEPGSERGLPCDTGLQDQIGERQYDYGCYGT